MLVSTQTILVVLVIAALLSLIERRWEIRYLQCAGRLLSGAFLIQFAMQFSSLRFYLFAGLGICWFALGLRDLHRQLTSRGVEVAD
jgi:hypothetical protein